MAAAVQAKTISDMIMSMELQRPRLTQWDLGIVLEALSKPPYEPLREASLSQAFDLENSLPPGHGFSWKTQ